MYLDIINALFNLDSSERENTLNSLVQAYYPDMHFFAMVLLSVVILTVGLILSDTTMIVAGMLVAPFLTPLLSVGMGVAVSDHLMIQKSVFVLAKATALAIFVSFVTAFFISVPRGFSPEILSRTYPGLSHLGVALATGIAASIAITKKNFLTHLIGVAVNLVILPPLAVVGIGLVSITSAVVRGSLELYLLNLFGIVLSAAVIFSLSGFHPSRNVVETATKGEIQKPEEEQSNESV